MSGAIGGATYGSLARILAGTDNLQSQYATLQQQSTTGQVSQSYGGLPQAGQALALTAVSERNSTYNDVITQVQGKASALQTAIGQITTLVNTSSAAALSETSTDQGSITAVAQQAKSAYQQIVSLLNTTYGGDYLFSGADTSNPPVPSPDTATTSGMYTQIGAQVQALNTVPSSTPVSQVIANTVAIAGSTAAGTTIFSSYLTTPAPAGGLGAPATQVQISDTQTVSLSLPANQNAGAESDPSINGTGNAINDILRGLAVLANSTSTTAASPDFQALMKDTATTLSSAGATLTQEGATIGTTQDTLTATATTNSDMQTLLTKQISGIEDVDPATVISKLQAVNTQIQTSYQVLAMAKNLSLASIL